MPFRALCSLQQMDSPGPMRSTTTTPSSPPPSAPHTGPVTAQQHQNGQQHGQVLVTESGPAPTLRDPLARQLLPDAKYSRINRWRSEIDPTDVVCSCSERLELWRSSISSFSGGTSSSTRKSGASSSSSAAAGQNKNNISSLCPFCHRVRDSAEQQQSSQRRWQRGIGGGGGGKRSGFSYSSFKSPATATAGGRGDVGADGAGGGSSTAAAIAAGTGTGVGGGDGSTTVGSRTTSFIKRFFHRRTSGAEYASSAAAGGGPAGGDARSVLSGLPSLRLGPPEDQGAFGGTQMYRQDEADDEASGSSIIGGGAGGVGEISDSDKGNRKPKLGVDDSAARLRRAQRLLNAQRKEKG